jgi:hypothetical protein
MEMGRFFPIAVTALTAGILGILTGVFGVRLADRTQIDWHTTVTVVRDVLASGGLLVGAVWTIYQVWRRRSLIPRAALSHRHQLWTQGSKRYLRVIFEIKNCGEVRIDPGQAYTHVQTAPTSKIDPTEIAEDSWHTIQRIEHPLADDEVVIEPGESEEYCYDVPIPDGATYLQLNTCVACASRKGNAAVGDGPATDPDLEDTLHWDATTLIDIASTPAHAGSFDATASRRSHGG